MSLTSQQSTRVRPVRRPLSQAFAAAAFVLMGSAFGGDVVGKVTVGYQGWLSAPGDGSLVNQWKHTNLECWPDVREYATTFSGCPFKQAGITQPGFNGNLGNGTPARIFSSWTDQTVNKHFEWMQQYGGIDCVAVQRFGSEFGNAALKDWKNGIATRVRTAAETYGRKYFIMYDISGWTNFQSEIKTDWTALKVNHITSPAYAIERGKPVVCVWGMGFSGRPGNAQSWKDVLDWFKAQGCYLIGGLTQSFHSDSGSYTDPVTQVVTTNKAAYKVCDMVMVWTVGKSSGFETLYQNGLNWCNANGMAYQADVYPGTAFYNTDFATDPNAVKNKRPRNHGDFMWSQFAAARNKGIQNIYISMFDELQEATQIFKTAEDASMIPEGKYFLTLDADGVACSSDFYLRLTRDGSDMIKGITPYVTTHPTEHIIGGTPGLGNLVLNPSFETGGSAPASWNRAGSAVGSNASAQDGAYSLRISAAGANNPTTQTISIQSGKTYHISVWINAAGLTSGPAVFDTSDKYDGVGQGQFVMRSANPGWTKYSGSFTATTTSVTLRMFTESAFAGTVYFDNIVFEELRTVGFGPWIGGFFPDSSDPAVIGFQADPDTDGLANGLEFVLGGNPSLNDAAALMPSGRVDGANFIFTYKRSDASKDGTTQIVQYGNSLGGWTDVTIAATSDSSGGAGFTVFEGMLAESPDTIVVTVPCSGSNRFFARLKVIQSSP